MAEGVACAAVGAVDSEATQHVGWARGRGYNNHVEDLRFVTTTGARRGVTGLLRRHPRRLALTRALRRGGEGHAAQAMQAVAQRLVHPMIA